jgi:hypothetical protein
MNIEYWKQEILSATKKISSEEYQQETWFGKGEQISSPEELYCTLLEDFLFEDFLTAENNGLSEMQRSLGEDLKNKMNMFSDSINSYKNPTEIINNQKWEEIRQVALKFISSIEP